LSENKAKEKAPKKKRCKKGSHEPAGETAAPRVWEVGTKAGKRGKITNEEGIRRLKPEINGGTRFLSRAWDRRKRDGEIGEKEWSSRARRGSWKARRIILNSGKGSVGGGQGA